MLLALTRHAVFTGKQNVLQNSDSAAELQVQDPRGYTASPEVRRNRRVQRGKSGEAGPGWQVPSQGSEASVLVTRNDNYLLLCYT